MPLEGVTEPPASDRFAGVCRLQPSDAIVLPPCAEVVSIAFRKSGMLASDGRCKTLDAAADGYVRAEAAGALFVEMLPDGQIQQASAGVTALVAGSAVGQDGRSSGLTAPNGPAQQEVMRAALTTANLAAGQVTAVQLHGTGTSLGDPIEVGALAAVMVAAPRKQPLALMAGKSLIGHSEPAAGVMGLAHAHLAVALSASLPIMHLQAGGLLLDGSFAPQHFALPGLSVHGLTLLLTQPHDLQSTLTSRRRCTRASGPCPAS